MFLNKHVKNNLLKISTLHASFCLTTLGSFSLQMMKDLRAAFGTGKTRSYEWRVSQLTALIKFVEENQKEINDALHKDLHKVRHKYLLE